MKILALEKDVPDVLEEQLTEALLAEEAARAWELHQSGVIRELHFRQDQRTAVLVLECEHVDEARSILHTLPLVKERLIDFELIPLIPYPGFARLSMKK